MDNTKLKSSKVYAWVLVIALGLMSAGTTGSYSVIAGSFVAPVCEEFGFDYSIFSYYFTATLIGLAAALPFVGKLIPKVVGKVWLPVVELILLAAGAGMAFYTEVCLLENSSPRSLARFGSPSSSLSCSPPAQAWPSTPKSGCSSLLAP